MTRLERVAPILALIRKNESAGAVRAQRVASPYDVVWSGIKPDDRPKKLSAMTVARVLWWQDLIDPKYMSEAAGAYQIMEDTLRGLNVDPKAVFDATTQDALALQLLDRRGWARCEAGKMTPEAFGNQLAMEWASLPVITGPKRGRSHYAGDGLNAAHETPQAVLVAIHAALNEEPAQEEPAAEPEDDFVGDVVAWIQAMPPGTRAVGEWLSQMPEEPQ